MGNKEQGKACKTPQESFSGIDAETLKKVDAIIADIEEKGKQGGIVAAHVPDELLPLIIQRIGEKAGRGVPRGNILDTMGLPQDVDWVAKQMMGARTFFDQRKEEISNYLLRILEKEGTRYAGENENDFFLLVGSSIAQRFFYLGWMVKEFDHRGLADKEPAPEGR